MASSQLPSTRVQIQWVSSTIRGLNVVTGTIQSLTGIGSLLQLFEFNPTGMLIGIYVALLGALLLCFECRFQTTYDFLRTNFGFLYTPTGLSMYLILLGFLDLGMAGDAFAFLAGDLETSFAAPQVNYQFGGTYKAIKVKNTLVQDKPTSRDLEHLLPPLRSN